MSRKLLNLGCGSRFHVAWINVDLTSHDPLVLAHDIRRPLPFESESIDAVYHSHVLEHLSRDEGRRLVAECFRVLRPEGVLRVVVPDLEDIARNYLATFERAARGETTAHPDHEWMSIELLDQLVRSESGGEMGQWLRRADLPNPKFVEQRIGVEVVAQPTTTNRVDAPHNKKRRVRFRLGSVRRFANDLQRRLSRAAVTLLEGPQAAAAMREAAFRQSGEVHRWMYDRVSLARLLVETGFADSQVVSAEASRIAGFAEFELDSAAGRVRKPDSLFVEAVRP